MGEHKAHVALYVKDEKTEKVYGVINRHVSINVDGQIALKTRQKEEYVVFAEHFVNREHDPSDIDLVEIDSNVADGVRNEIENENGLIYKAVTYHDSLENLHGKQVFKLRPRFSDFKVNADKTSEFGIVDSKKFGPKFFVVKGNNGAFSEEGDSGTPIALWNSEENEYVVAGFVVGDIGGLTCCWFLPEALKYLEKTYCMTLSTRLANKYINPRIPIGSKIYINCPSIPKISVDLIATVTEIAVDTFHGCEVKSFAWLVEKENELKKHLYDRNQLDLVHTSYSDSPVWKAVENSLHACDCMFKGLHVDTELYLKEAIFYIMKCPDIKLRLFGKFVTYLTWYLVTLDTNEQNQRLEKLFKSILHFCNLNKDKEGFPVETFVNLSLDVSRYYQKLYSNVCSPQERYEKLRKEAIDWSAIGHTLAKSIYEKRVSRFSAARLTLAKTEEATSLVGCGHSFVNAQNTDVQIPFGDIEKAEKLLNEEVTEETCFAMQIALYQLARCDLCFRRGQIKEAYEYAQDCHKQASQKQMRFLAVRAFTRMEFLKRVIAV